MTLLAKIPLHKSLLKAIQKLGFIEATAVQERAIPAVMEGKDLMVSAQTGSGKTAAFLLPLLHRLLTTEIVHGSTRALILLPTRELVLQTQSHFEKLAAFTYIKCGRIIGGEAFKHQVATLRKNPEVIIATPGRLVDHIEKGTTDFSDLEMLVLDEADRMLDMGFAIAMNSIADSCNPDRQNLLFSATLNHKGLNTVNDFFFDPLILEIDSPRQQHRNITQQRVLVDDIKHRQKVVIGLLQQEQEARRVIIFCKTRAQCQQLSNLLRSHKLKANYLHGEIAQNDRKQVLNQFRQGSIPILVATDLAARGLDIKEIDLVINYSVAQSGDEHVHRVGRTGRAGQTGTAITLVGSSDWDLMSRIERYLKIRLTPRDVKGLKAVYSGPKKLKKSGKAAGNKKKKNNTSKARPASNKAHNKPAKKSKKIASRPVKGDGFNTIKRKK